MACIEAKRSFRQLVLIHAIPHEWLRARSMFKSEFFRSV